MPMSMTLKFRTLAQFFFMEWKSETVLGLILGCQCCIVLAFIMMAMPEIKRRLLLYLDSQARTEGSVITESDYKSLEDARLNFKQKVVSVFIYFLHAFLHVVIMVIIMNMNFYVIISIILGASAGYLVTSNEYCAKKAQNNCCQQNNSAKGELVQQSDRHYKTATDS